MKINLNFFKNRKKFRKEKISNNPNLYWRGLLILIAILILLSIVFAFYLLEEVGRESDFSPDPNKKIEVVRKNRLEKALNYFDLRAQKSNSILNTTSPIIDPSL